MDQEQKKGGITLMLEIRTLDSKIQILAQRLKIIEKNEQIIGKTLISHSRLIKELQSGGAPGVLPAAPADIGPLRDEIEDVKSELGRLKSEIDELKYVLETINPVAYVTVDEIDELIEEKLKKLKKRKEAA